MGVNNSWSQNQSMNDWMRDIEKRLMNEERRPLFQAANALVGPGIGTYTRQVTDWNSQGPVVNGFFYSYGDQIVNSPDDTKDWVGLVLADPDGHGFQQVWEYVEGVSPGQDVTGSPVTGATSYTRSYITNDDGTRTYSVWSVGSGGGGGIAGIIVEDENIVVNAAALELNFVGNGVVATGAGNEATITISGIPPDNSVGASQIIDGSVTTTEIADGTIAVADLNATTINSLMVDVGEEGSTVVTNANRINFIGTNVLAEADGLGGANVTISGGSGGSTPGVGTPVGTVSLWTGTTAPQGWLLCQGGTFAGSTYPELRDLLGDKFGVHSGDNYFLPDYRDRYPLGASTAHPLNTASTYSTAGTSNGPLMTAAQVGQHSHTASVSGTNNFLRHVGTGGNINEDFSGVEAQGQGLSVTVANSAAPTAPYFPPYLAQNFIIKAAPGGGTDGVNMLVVADEGTTVASAVTKINYVGAGVVATAGAAGEAVVTVSGVPPASSVTSAMIADGTIVAGDLADGAVTSAKILDGTIATADLGDAQVTLAKLATASVDSTKIVDGSVALGDLAPNSVDASKIVDGSVGNAELGANAVSTDKILDGTILATDLAAGVIPTTLPPSGAAGGDLTGSTYPNPVIANGAVTSAKIADGTIVDADISATAAIQQSKVANLTTDLAAKAPLASPALTGNPTAPTPTAGDNDTSIATTAFVTGAVATSAATKADAARNLAAGAGLTGGGNLTADRTFDVGAGTGIVVAADSVSVDTSVIATRAYADANRVDVQDEGTGVVTDATTLNFVGAGVTATGVGGIATINIPGGGAAAAVHTRRLDTSGVSVPNSSSTPLPWATIESNIGGITYSSPDFTVPVEGLYQINVGIGWVANTTGRREMTVRLNGVTKAYHILPASTSVAQILSNSVSVVFACVAGDTIQVYAVQNTGAALALIGTTGVNYLSITRIGSAT